jgi:hypothetical protein
MLAGREDRHMTLAELTPELPVLMVSTQQGTIIDVVHRNGEAYEVEFSKPVRVDWMPS